METYTPLLQFDDRGFAVLSAHKFSQMPASVGTLGQTPLNAADRRAAAPGVAVGPNGVMIAV